MHSQAGIWGRRETFKLGKNSGKNKKEIQRGTPKKLRIYTSRVIGAFDSVVKK